MPTPDTISHERWPPFTFQRGPRGFSRGLPTAWTFQILSVLEEGVAFLSARSHSSTRGPSPAPQPLSVPPPESLPMDLFSSTSNPFRSLTPKHKPHTDTKPRLPFPLLRVASPLPVSPQTQRVDAVSMHWHHHTLQPSCLSVTLLLSILSKSWTATLCHKSWDAGCPARP